MGYQSSEHTPLVIVIPAGTRAADVTIPACYIPYKSKLKSAHLVDGVGIAASDTDFLIAQLKNGSTVLAAYDTRAAGQGALAANVAKAMSLTAVEQEIAAGSSLTLVLNETDSGTAVTTTDMLLVLHLIQKQNAG